MRYGVAVDKEIGGVTRAYLRTRKLPPFDPLSAAYLRISAWKGTRHFASILLFVGLASVITISNLGTTREFIGFDAGGSMLVPATTVRQLAAWSDLYAPGVPLGAAALSTLWVGLAYLLSVLGASSSVIERIFYGLLMFSAAFSSYLLSITILTRLFGLERSIRTSLAAFVGAAWYCFNPYSLLLMTRPVTTHEIAWAVIPLGLTVLLRGLYTGWPFAGGLAFAAVWLTIMTGNAALTLVGIALAVLLVGLLLFKKGLPPARGRRFLGWSVALTIGFGAYIWFPLIASGVSPFGYASRINALSTTTTEAEHFNSLRTSISNIWRTDGSIAFPEQSYFQLVETGPPWLFAAYAAPAVAFASVWFLRGRNRRIAITLVIVALTFMFLAKGEHDPFPQPVTWLYGHVYPFAIFRNSHDKFMLATLLIEGILLSAAFAWLFSRRLHVGVASALLAGALLVPFASLFLLGRVADHKYLTDIPSEYQQLKKFLALPGASGAIFSGPDFGGFSYLRWYQGSQSPDPSFLGVPTVTEQWLRSTGFQFDANDRPGYVAQFDQALDLLPALGVRYVLIHKDVLPTIPTGDYEHPLVVPTGSQLEAVDMIDTIAFRPDLGRVMSNDYFDLYVYCDGAVYPDVFATRSLIVGNPTKGNSSARKDASCTSGLAPVSVSVRSSSLPLGTATNNDSSLPSVVVQASAPGYRLLRIHHATAPFILALSQTYDPQWRAYAASSPGTSELPLISFTGGEIPEHAVGDGTINVWLVRETGDYWLTLVYRPQGLLLLGAWLSACFATILIIGVGIRLLVSRGGHRRKIS
jgi:hypothetical protein